MPRCGCEKVYGCFLDLLPTISVGDHVDVAVLASEDEALQNLGLGIRPRNQLPFFAPGKERTDSESSAPVQIGGWVVTISQTCRDGNDSLVDVIAERDEHMDDRKLIRRCGRLSGGRTIRGLRGRCGRNGR